MTAMRFLFIVAVMLAATTRIVAADDKKSSTKSGTQGIEIKDYGFGVSSPTSISRSGANKTGNGAPSSGNAGRSGGRH